MRKIVVFMNLTLDGVMQAPGRPDEDRLFHAIRADLLKRLGRTSEAALAYEAALTRTENATERDFLQRSLDRLSDLGAQGSL